MATKNKVRLCNLEICFFLHRVLLKKYSFTLSLKLLLKAERKLLCDASCCCYYAGITFPSGAVQKQLLEETYHEAGVDPSQVAYVEAHGTGTKVGDPQEVNSIVDVFCKDRNEPLLIGSTKSNMGHPEPASG